MLLLLPERAPKHVAPLPVPRYKSHRRHTPAKLIGTSPVGHPAGLRPHPFGKLSCSLGCLADHWAVGFIGWLDLRALFVYHRM